MKHSIVLCWLTMLGYAGGSNSGQNCGTWEDWVGQTVKARYRLQRLGDDRGIRNATPHRGKSKAAIKLVAASASDGDILVANWKRAAQLSHPHLLQVFDGGRCWVSGRELGYVITEFADENLAQVLPHRPLTAGETDTMLRPTVAALTYLHDQALVHGDLRPANVMAVGDQLKLFQQIPSVGPAWLPRLCRTITARPNSRPRSLAEAEGRPVASESANAKLYTAEAAVASALDAIQLRGGHGYST